MTGVEKLTVPNAKAFVVGDLDRDGVAEIAVLQGDALVLGSAQGGKWQERGRFDRASLPLMATPVAPQGLELEYRLERRPITVRTRRGPAWVAAQDPDGDGRSQKILLLTAPPGQPLYAQELAVDEAEGIVPVAAVERWLVVTGVDGRMRVIDPEGHQRADWDASGAFFTIPTVGDVDGDGRNEMLYCRGDGKVAVVRPPTDPDGAWEMLWEAAGSGFPLPYPMVLVADLNGDGRKEVLVSGRTRSGQTGVRLLDWQGQLLWDAPYPTTQATFGDFNGDGHRDVYLAVRMPTPGNVTVKWQSVALNGRTGEVLWHNDGSDPQLWHHQMAASHLMPTVCDVNGDGIDDVLFTALDLCTELNGKDGIPIHEPLIANTIFQQTPGMDTQWTAYGLQMPKDIDGDGKDEILLVGSWGGWGAWTMDRQLLWTMDPGKATLSRRTAGVADVDGDGRLEMGLLLDGGTFRCLDAATGRTRWEIEGLAQQLDVLTADVDGDGRQEFVVGSIALKADDPEHGRILWQATQLFSAPPAIADLDGDGKCELVGVCGDAQIRVLK
jgi:outer membrane protein assembly factor BamB